MLWLLQHYAQNITYSESEEKFIYQESSDISSVWNGYHLAILTTIELNQPVIFQHLFEHTQWQTCRSYNDPFLIKLFSALQNSDIFSTSPIIYKKIFIQIQQCLLPKPIKELQDNTLPLNLEIHLNNLSKALEHNQDSYFTEYTFTALNEITQQLIFYKTQLNAFEKKIIIRLDTDLWRYSSILPKIENALTLIDKFNYDYTSIFENESESITQTHAKIMRARDSLAIFSLKITHLASPDTQVGGRLSFLFNPPKADDLNYIKPEHLTAVLQPEPISPFLDIIKSCIEECDIERLLWLLQHYAQNITYSESEEKFIYQESSDISSVWNGYHLAILTTIELNQPVIFQHLFEHTQWQTCRSYNDPFLIKLFSALQNSDIFSTSPIIYKKIFIQIQQCLLPKPIKELQDNTLPLNLEIHLNNLSKALEHNQDSYFTEYTFTALNEITQQLIFYKTQLNAFEKKIIIRLDTDLWRYSSILPKIENALTLIDKFNYDYTSIFENESESITQTHAKIMRARDSLTRFSLKIAHLFSPDTQVGVAFSFFSNPEKAGDLNCTQPGAPNSNIVELSPIH